jgi:hypothetical protein
MQSLQDRFLCQKPQLMAIIAQWHSMQFLLPLATPVTASYCTLNLQPSSFSGALLKQATHQPEKELLFHDMHVAVVVGKS